MHKQNGENARTNVTNATWTTGIIMTTEKVTNHNNPCHPPSMRRHYQAKESRAKDRAN